MRRVDREALSALTLLESPLWVFDLDREQPWWANEAALTLFNAANVETLQARRVFAPIR